MGRFQYVARITVDVTFVQLMVLAKSLEQVVTVIPNTAGKKNRLKYEWSAEKQL